MEDTTAQPSDWMPYRARAAFNLFELAALLSRQDPERLAHACFAEYVAFNRAQGLRPSADTPHHFRGMVDTLPCRMLGDEVGELLKALKKAAGATTYAVVPLGTAQRAADALGVSWPPELPTPAPTDDEPAKAPARQDQELKRIELVKRHSACWQAIERDLKDASVNGLREAAGAKRWGWWREGAALDWARARGKLLDAGKAVNSVFNRVR